MAQAVNTTCPICGMETDPSSSVTWKGQSIAFCCQDCVSDWSSLSESDKKEKMDDIASGEQEDAA